MSITALVKRSDGSPVHAGDLIVVSAGVNENAGDQNFTLTNPDGVVYTTVPPQNNSGAVKVRQWYRVATGVETQLTMATDTAADLGLDIRVDQGGYTGDPLDVHSGAVGTGVTADPSATGATFQASEFAVASVANKGNSQQGAPTNGFVQVTDVVSANATNANRVRLGVYTKLLSAIGAQDVAVTIAAAQAWAASLAVFIRGPVAQTIDPTGIASAGAFGTAKVNLAVSPTGIASSEAFGSPTVLATTVVHPDGIASSEAFGTATVIAAAPGAQTVIPTGIASAQALGTPQVNLKVFPNPVTSSQAFGTAKVNLKVSPTAIGSAEAFGAPTLATFTGRLLVTGSVVVVREPQVSVVVSAPAPVAVVARDTDVEVVQVVTA